MSGGMESIGSLLTFVLDAVTAAKLFCKLESVTLRIGAVIKLVDIG